MDRSNYYRNLQMDANLFDTLISELYEKHLVIITSNMGFDNWAEKILRK